MHFWQTKARKLRMKVTRWDMFTLSFWRQTTASWGITVSEWEPLVFGLFISQKSNYTLLNTSQQVLLNYVMRWKGPITWKKVPDGPVVRVVHPGKKQIKCQWKCSLKRVTEDFNTQQLFLIITGWCHVFNCAHLMASSSANPFRGQCLWVFTDIPSPVIDWLASMREKKHTFCWESESGSGQLWARCTLHHFLMEASQANTRPWAIDCFCFGGLNKTWLPL